MPQNQIRIIGGKWRRRMIDVPAALNLRPTPNRVRETVFNWLQFELQNALVLDVFCGSGALTLEALSRGAKKVYAFDINNLAVSNLKVNLVKLFADNAQVYQQNVIDYLQNPAELQFDIVFLDPPFKFNLLEQCCDLLEANSFLKLNALIYCESDKDISYLKVPINWNLTRSKQAGKVYYGLFRRN